jgi:hypothetical protein
MKIGWDVIYKALTEKLERDLEEEVKLGLVWDSLDHLIVLSTLDKIDPGLTSKITEVSVIKNIEDLKKILN